MLHRAVASKIQGAPDEAVLAGLADSLGQETGRIQLDIELDPLLLTT